MADIKDAAAAVASALTEIGVDGVAEVEVDSEHLKVPVGEDRGQDSDVVVKIEPQPKR